MPSPLRNAPNVSFNVPASASVPGYGLAERLLLVLDLIKKTHCLSFFLMWIGGVPNTASLADGRKFLRASSHDLVVVREVAGASEPESMENYLNYSQMYQSLC